jgi:hypothetical protein
MKISVDDVELFRLTDIQKAVIKDDVVEDHFELDMKRRLQYILMHKYEECFATLKKEWEPKLSKRLSLLPTNKDEFAKLVFSQPDYRSRKQRISEEQNRLKLETK